ncbi:hypothetical protein EVAR_60933_1 [Eumeta japonica]|uniref:Uncharacterized protein n=1 Tax=Eumeta variegata TaxID=151549 RepID=A0A4C1ZH45_EUMVA|nr:hypothetical protein EVAR_60933_1 [Eumeta japonica]
MFPVAKCSLLLPYIEVCNTTVECDCLKFFKNFQVELEKLNAATDEINRLELELDVAKYRILPSLTEFIDDLERMALFRCDDQTWVDHVSLMMMKSKTME